MTVTQYKINTIINELLKSLSSLKHGERIDITMESSPLKAFFIAALFKRSGRTLFVVTPTRDEGERFARDVIFFLGREAVKFYPPWEVLPFEDQSPHPETMAARMEILSGLLTERPGIVITTPSSIMQRVISREMLIDSMEEVESGMSMDMQHFIERVQSIGYSRLSLVEERGEMSVRGCIMDIFPPIYQKPIRIEFYGDIIENIRFFNPATQLSGEVIDRATILPGSELLLKSDSRALALKELKRRADEAGIARNTREEVAEHIRNGTPMPGLEFLLPLFYQNMETIFDYLPDDTISVYDREIELSANIHTFQCEISEMADRALKKNRLFIRPEDLYLKTEQIKDIFKHSCGLYLDNFNIRTNGALPSPRVTIDLPAKSNLDIRQDISLRKNEILSPLAYRIREWLQRCWQVFLVVSTIGQAERLRDILSGYSIIKEDVRIIEGPSFHTLDCILHSDTMNVSVHHSAPGAGSISIIVGDLGNGFRLPEAGLAIITENEIFGERVHRRRPPSRRVDAFLTQLQDLNRDDYVVHREHGIGIYRELKRLNIENVENDFLVLEYQDGDRLYIPVQQLDLISKYKGIEGKMPPIDKLGGMGWIRTKRKVKKAVKEMAVELLNLYASRNIAEGFAFSGPDRLFTEFEASFKYDETPDQRDAIMDVLNDMERAIPMDRVICGDVGYGKTEVGMRAAFKAVFDGKQVAVLVPTTILAKQHYITFKERFAPYPVNIELLSRFKTRSEQKGILKRVESGETDIIIGTHRILQGDINFKDLGILIIDEEHRFGVRHKERLKHLKKNLDVLTLTATPIPRTLHMSLAAIRDISIINTPPEDRLAIKTIVTRFDKSIVRDAIIREISRGGQVFFVHNRVKGIEIIADTLKEIVPEARIAVAHGQMHVRELERIMESFIKKRFDVLLSTSIIESGLDIPSANTILINRADMFGLAEIYQLRGRVGRSRHRAYAYLLVPAEKNLTPDAKKRLAVLKELNELGSGFRIAAYDLEIRGAGELLGSAQSGRIADVGFDMYTQLLEEAMSELKGEKVTKRPEPVMRFMVSAYIPEEYLPDARQRLNIYRRLATVGSDEELDGLRLELRDRFGRIPQLVDNLFMIISIKLMLKRIGILELVHKGRYIHLRFGKDTGLDIDRFLNIINIHQEKFRFTPDLRLICRIDNREPIVAAKEILQLILKGC